jgi:Domain of unknown function (DUF4440)
MSDSEADEIEMIASRDLVYHVWEPQEIAARVYTDSAVVRYRATIENTAFGTPMALSLFWHTDAYAKRNGRWQVVWSQATGVVSGRPKDLAAFWKVVPGTW